MKKKFDIDWDDPKDIKKYISILQLRRKNILREYGYNEVNFNGSKYNLDNLLPLFQTFFDYVVPEKGNNYVYFHCNPLKKLNIKSDIKHIFLASKFPNLNYEPFYVGKGNGNRAFELNRNDSHRKIRNQINKFGKEIEPIIIIDNISENCSLSYENIFMYILGLRALSNNGILVNLMENDIPELNNKVFSTDIGKKLIKKNGFKILT